MGNRIYDRFFDRFQIVMIVCMAAFLTIMYLSGFKMMIWWMFILFITLFIGEIITLDDKTPAYLNNKQINDYCKMAERYRIEQIGEGKGIQIKQRNAHQNQNEFSWPFKETLC